MQSPEANQGTAFKKPSQHRVGTLVIWVAAALVVTTFLIRGPACGADFVFHFSSWHDVANGWRQSIVYPHWAASANFGAGEPRLVFYPPLSWLSGAALGLVLPWHFVPIALNFLLLAATGLATRALARVYLSEAAATLAGATALASGYELFEVYCHSDFALLSGGAWIPLLLLLLLQPRGVLDSGVRKLVDRRTLLLALVLAGTWLSNTPLGLMACYVIAGLALVTALQERSWTPLLRSGIAIALGFGLVAFYLVPAVFEQRWVDITKLFAQPEHLIQNRWLTTELRGSHRIRGFIEVYMLVLALGGLAGVWRRGLWPSRQQPQARRRWLALALIVLTTLFLMFPVSRPVWEILPKLRYLEYPWRWLVVLQAPMAILFAVAVWPSQRRWQPYVAAACALFLLAYTVIASTKDTLFLPCPTNFIADLNQALQPGGAGVGGTDEYATPPGASNTLVPLGLPDACFVSSPFQVLSTVPARSPFAFYSSSVWSPALDTCRATFHATDQGGRQEHLQLTAQVQEAGYLVLRLRSYPAWRVVVNGQPLHAFPRRADGLIAVPVPRGHVDLTVDWGSTPDMLVGRAVSALSLLVALLLWWKFASEVREETAASGLYGS